MEKQQECEMRTEKEELIEVICELKMKYSHDKVLRIVQVLYSHVVNGKISLYHGNGNKINPCLQQSSDSTKIEHSQYQDKKIYDKKLKKMCQKYDSIHFVKSWTKVNELQFLHLYLKEKKIGLVRNKLRQKYGLTQVFQNIRELTFRFYKTIRFCLNKIDLFSKKYPTQLPQILPYKSNVINKILISPETIDIRLTLIKIHLMPEQDMQLILQGIVSVNDFIRYLREQWWKDGYKDWIQTDLDIDT